MAAVHSKPIVCQLTPQPNSPFGNTCLPVQPKHVAESTFTRIKHRSCPSEGFLGNFCKRCQRIFHLPKINSGRICLPALSCYLHRSSSASQLCLSAAVHQLHELDDLRKAFERPSKTQYTLRDPARLSAQCQHTIQVQVTITALHVSLITTSGTWACHTSSCCSC